eukprot:10817454-Heterocapsa_arctica.AAC.1
MGGTVLEGELAIASLRSAVDDPPLEGEHQITEEELDQMRRMEEVERWEARPPWFMTEEEIEG